MTNEPEAGDRPIIGLERKRRVLLLCIHCARNLGYYRAGREDTSLFDRSTFWRNVYNNFLDLSVLEWCKLFGDVRGDHFWLTISGDDFEPAFLKELGVAMKYHDEYVNKMRSYRDKFVAHLDSARTMEIPEFDHALATVALYYKKVRTTIEDESEISDLPVDFMAAYDVTISDGGDRYHKASVESA